MRQTPFRVNRCLMGALVPAVRDGRGAITLGDPMGERLDPGNVATLNEAKETTMMTQQEINGICEALRSQGLKWEQTNFVVALVRDARAAEQASCAPLEWTDATPPDHASHYDHCFAETPFGRFMLTWKGWNTYPSYTADETPWNEWAGTWNTLAEAKQACETEFARRLQSCLAVTAP